jgi:hypothetical protein
VAILKLAIFHKKVKVVNSKDVPKNTEQSALRDVNVDGNLTIDSISQTINYINQISPSLTEEQRKDLKARSELLKKLYTRYFSKLNHELIIPLTLDELAPDCYCDIEKKNDIYISRSKSNSKLPSKNIVDIFKNFNEGNIISLVIVGDSGVGKTTLLQEFGNDLCQSILQLISIYQDSNDDQLRYEKLERILDKKIPVFLELSSWQKNEKTSSNTEIHKWILQELNEKYGFPVNSDIVSRWSEDRKFLLLLDGFELLDSDSRKGFAKKIQEYTLNNTIICSRLSEYEDFGRNNFYFDVDSLVRINPLSEEQVYQYIEKRKHPSSEQAFNPDALINDLSNKKELLELARIPFWLNIMIEVYSGNVRNFISEHSNELDYQNTLFRFYISQKLESSKNNKYKYSKKEIIQWLKWLAEKSTKADFLIEKMQPEWLTKHQKKLYLIVTLGNGFALGLSFGLLYGMIIQFYLAVAWNIDKVHGAFLGIVAGTIIGTSAQWFLKIHKQSIRVHPQEFKFSFKKVWKILKSGAGLYESICVGFLVFFFCLLILPLFNFFPRNLSLLLGLVGGFFFAIVTLIVRLFSNLPEDQSIKTVKPNQGIWNSLNKALLITKITAIILAIVNTLIILLIHHSLGFPKLVILLTLGLCVAVITGVVAPFIHDSGRVCQQHFALRVVLYLSGCIPWNYAHFLDYASDSKDLSFMKKIGGHYQFLNEMFKDYLKNEPLTSDFEEEEE